MSTTEKDSEIVLNAQEIRERISLLSASELAIFRDLFIDIKTRGVDISDVTIDELAKKYADKARHLAGDGGEK